MFLSFTPFDPLRSAIMNSIFKAPLSGIGSLDQELATLIRDLFLQQVRRAELLDNRIEISNRNLGDIADVN